jgi:hypothetical protein
VLAAGDVVSEGDDLPVGDVRPAGNPRPGGDLLPSGDLRPAGDLLPSGDDLRPATSPTTSALEASASFPSRDQLVQAWGDGLLSTLPNRARARFRVGRFVSVEDATAIFALPNETHRSYCEQVRLEVEHALMSHFGLSVPLRLVVDDDPEVTGPMAPSPGVVVETGIDDDEADLLDPDVLAASTEPAGAVLSPAERLKLAFPGAVEV